MDINVYELAPGAQYSPTNALLPSNFIHSGIYLNTLKVSNIKQEAATKVFNIGINAMPFIKWGKNVKIEIQDALGKESVLRKFLNFVPDANNNLYIDHNFMVKPLFLEGRAPIINPYNGMVQDMYIQIPCFIPESTSNLIFDSGSNVGVFNLNGSAYPAKLLIQNYSSGQYQENTFIYKISNISYFTGYINDIYKDADGNLISTNLTI